MGGVWSTCVMGVCGGWVCSLGVCMGVCVGCGCVCWVAVWWGVCAV